MTAIATQLTEYDFIVCIDTSGSMGEPVKSGSSVTRWESVLESALTFVRDIEKIDSDGDGSLSKADLARLTGLTAQTIGLITTRLDDDGRRDVLRDRAQRRGLVVDDAALDWLLTRTDRDLGALVVLLDRLDRASLAAQRRITVPFLRQVL